MICAHAGRNWAAQAGARQNLQRDRGVGKSGGNGPGQLLVAVQGDEHGLRWEVGGRVGAAERLGCPGVGQGPGERVVAEVDVIEVACRQKLISNKID